MTHAIIKTGGKQYRVTEGDKISVEKLQGEVGDELTFGEVLSFTDGSDTTLGEPHIDGAKVVGTVIDQFRDKKVIAFKFKRRKGHHKTKGHRRHMTKVEITSISA